MDFLDMLLGRDNRRNNGRNDNLFDMLGGFSRWIIGCGCLLILVLVGGIGLLLAGVIRFGDQAILVMVVIGAIVAAVASLVRSSLLGH